MSQAGAGFVLLYYLGASVLVAIPAVPALLWLRYFVRRHVAPLPASYGARWHVKVLRGLALGLALFVVTVAPAWLGGHYSPQQADWQLFASGGEAPARLGTLYLAGLFVFQAAYEELLFRGLALPLFGLLLLWILGLLGAGQLRHPAGKVGLRAWGMVGITAAVIIGAAFSINHANNPAVSTLALGNIALAGLLLCLVAWLDGDVWGAWGLHFCWNFTQAVCGLPVSGIRVNAHGPITGAVPGLWTGGAFGPEASLGATVALLAGICFTGWRLRKQWSADPTAGGRNAGTAPSQKT